MGVFLNRAVIRRSKTILARSRAAGKVSIQKDSLGRFMNPWEIPRRGCDLLAGQREYALRFWPAFFDTTWNTRETQAPSA